jgi:hypothetical protein
VGSSMRSRPPSGLYFTRVFAAVARPAATRTAGTIPALLWQYGQSGDDTVGFGHHRWAIWTKIVRDRTAYLTRCSIERFTKVGGWP